ncbi:MAG: Asp-tRNA(Asn)/Glu-tRNA(Gln) amidotransferase subunit GatB, partial [Betaproteobacteria bacterium]|nr:Asp-tRNA(Asn)/Glu-tRNA(Gln) amidotransferase subunit GatB [Betaproteobacteria bacterium]
QASAVDVALPGVLPVLNRRAVEYAIRFALAVGATINRRSVFARKNYFYPDLPKGYQISQFEIPIVGKGSLKVVVPDGEKTVRLVRAHLEEDAGKSLHEDFHGMSGIDLNRAGTPLLEIVTEPDLRGAGEAVAYARALHALVRWIGICDGNMQEGSFRCDANVSVRRPGDPLGTRAEIKNLNSFRFMERAIEFEARRQIEILEDGGKIVQETRLYDPERDQTRPMRSKEDAHDYRYFPDPDLLPLALSPEWIEAVRVGLPELPGQRKDRFMKSFGLSEYDASVLTSDKEIGEYFEGVMRASLRDGESSTEAHCKLCANWVINEVAANRNQDNVPACEFGVSDATLGRLLRRVRDGVINAKTAKSLFAEFWDQARSSNDLRQSGNPGRVDELIESRGLRQTNDSSLIEALVDEVLAANARQVEDYRAGKEKAFNSLVGQVMKATSGKANPQQVNDILRRKLSS